MKGFNLNAVYFIVGFGLVLGIVLYFNYREFYFFEFARFLLSLAVLGFFLTAIGEILRNYAKASYVPDSRAFFSRLFERMFWDVGPPVIGMLLALVIIWVYVLNPPKPAPITANDIAVSIPLNPSQCVSKVELRLEAAFLG